MPFRKARKHKTTDKNRNYNHIARPAIEALETRQLLSSTSTVSPDLVVTPLASTSTFTGYTPAQIKAAYGFNAISGNGAGQTIAIVDAYDDPNIAADLKAFDAKYGIADTTLTKVSETGGSTKNVAADAGWAEEIALDVEWAHAIAPGAKIVLVEASSDSISDLMAAVDTARRISGVSVVSMSWGTSEFTNDTYYDKYFTTPKGHTPVTFVAASGDEGSAYGPDFPATSNYVLAVGGTTLNLTSSGTYASETAWSDSTGGVSSVEAEPSYQASVQTTGARSSPDVSYDANPNTGFAVYDSYQSSGWEVVGGTSAGAPQWAALIALADQARAAKGLAALDGATNTLPTLYSLYTATNYSGSFHDVTSGRSSMFYSATSGYDAVTGLGTPEAASVVSALTTAVTTPLTTISVSRSRARARAASVRAAAETLTTDATVESTVLPNRPVVVYSMAPNSAPGIFNALVDSNESQVASSTFATTPIVASAKARTVAAPLDDFYEAGAASAPVDTIADWRRGFAPNAFAQAMEKPALDEAALFADASLMFSHEATNLMPVPAVAAATTHSVGAFMTTLGALALEAIVIGKWYSRHAEGQRRAQRAASPFSLERIHREGSPRA